MSPQCLIWDNNESFWTFTSEIMVFQVVVEVTSLVTWQDLEFPLQIFAHYCTKNFNNDDFFPFKMCNFVYSFHWICSKLLFLYLSSNIQENIVAMMSTTTVIVLPPENCITLLNYSYLATTSHCYLLLQSRKWMFILYFSKCLVRLLPFLNSIRYC